MEWWIWVLITVGVLAVLVLLTAYICFALTFLAQRKKTETDGELDLPGEIYEPFRDQMVAWMREAAALPHDDVQITSFDGLTLRGKYYECQAGAPVELMMHGYRGRAERDLCGGVQRCFALGRNALIVDQRACGDSEGRVITFGVKESRDCLSWVEYLNGRFGPDVKIMLTGISMGASTVLTAAGQPLPDTVVGVLADCGYTSARTIIKKVIRQLKLPADLLYPFVRLGALLFGGFDPNDAPPVEVLRNCRIPVIFYHGDADDFVPCDMSRENYAVCPTDKQLVIIPNAGHGLSYLVDPDTYLSTLREFSGRCGM